MNFNHPSNILTMPCAMLLLRAIQMLFSLLFKKDYAFYQPIITVVACRTT
jgi:hypothetical protein